MIEEESIIGYINAGDIIEEVDPVFAKSPAATITYSDITYWNDKANLTDIPTRLSQLQNDMGFIDGEKDPIFKSSPAYTITMNDIESWNNKSNFSGNYNDLTNKPTLFSGDYNDLTNKPTLFSGDYNDLTNKPIIPAEMQYSTMPTADSTTLGKIVQYTGVTDSTYTNGYFYIGTSEEENDETIYSWENIDVQPSSGGGGTSEYAIVTSAGLYTDELAQAVDKEYQKFLAGQPYCVYFWGGSNIANTLIPLAFYYQFANNIVISGWTPTKLISSSKKIIATVYVSCTASGGHITSVWGLDNSPIYILNNSGSIELISTNNTTQYPVTLDYHPAHKKYVDDKPTTYAGYDATKTQVLKNVQGTLTWVDET